jgi:hypothetical protein
MAEDVKMNRWWVQMAITAGTILAALGIAWGAYGNKVGQLEKRVDQIQSDHDILITLNTKMDLVMKDLCEVKIDLKKHLEQ